MKEPSTAETLMKLDFPPK